jgi:hypothetical protein
MSRGELSIKSAFFFIPTVAYALLTARMAYLIFFQEKLGAIAVQELFSMPSSFLVLLCESYIPWLSEHRDLRWEFVAVFALGLIQWLVVGFMLKAIAIRRPRSQ